MTKQEPWDQVKFERLLIEWLVASDQPFSEVKSPELIDLLNYVHRGAKDLKISSCYTVKRRVMEMGEEGFKKIKLMFEVSCEFQI